MNYDKFTLPGAVACEPYPTGIKTRREGGLVTPAGPGDLVALSVVFFNADLRRVRTDAPLTASPGDKVYVKVKDHIKGWATEVYTDPSGPDGKPTRFVLVPVTDIVLVERCAASS